jgi:hypothetical protein
MKMICKLLVLVLLAACSADEQEDPYKVLGVTKRSSQVFSLLAVNSISLRGMKHEPVFKSSQHVPCHPSVSHSHNVHTDGDCAGGDQEGMEEAGNTVPSRQKSW